MAACAEYLKVKSPIEMEACRGAGGGSGAGAGRPSDGSESDVLSAYTSSAEYTLSNELPAMLIK